MAGRVYQTAIEIGATIAKAFRGDALNAAKALDNLTASTKKLKEAEKVANSYKRLDDAVKSSKARLDQASDALKRIEQAERNAGGATKESTKWRKAGERAVAAASREFDRATKAANKNAEALRKAGVDTAKLATEQERLARTLGATERAEKSLSRFQAARTRLFGEKKESGPLFGKAREQIGGIARDVAILGTAAVGAGAAVAGLALKTLKAGDEIGDTAEKLGISAQALQELRYGAQQSGAEVGSLDRALAKMAVNIGKSKAAKGKGGSLFLGGVEMSDLKSGASAAAKLDPFKQIGLNAKQLSTLKPEQQLAKIADGMKKLKTHAEKAAVGQAIFGKGATDILPYLEEGSAGIEKLSKSAHKYGGVLSKETLDAADAADKAMKDAELAFSGLTATLGGQLLPVAIDVFKTFSQWVADNRVQIKQWAEKAATWITGTAIPAIKKIAIEAKALAEKIFGVVNKTADLVGGFGNLAIVVAGLRLAPLALTFGKIGINVVKASISLVRYVAAQKAMAVATGTGNLTTSLLGATGGLLAFAAAAGAVYLAITQITAAVKELGGAGAVWNDLKDFVARGGMDHMTRTGGGNRDLFEQQRAENEQNLAKARALKAAGVAPAGAGAGGVSAPIQVVYGASPAELLSQLEQAQKKQKDAVAKELARHEAQKRRVSFAH